MLELLPGADRMRRQRRDSMRDKISKYRGVLLLVSVPLVLVCIVLLLMPRTGYDAAITDPFDRDMASRFSKSNSSKDKNYAVIIDAGSSGSRVHVFCFDKELNLVPIGKELELFVQKKPGLSSYADNPKEGADSLKSLLEEALKVVPEDVQSVTPVRVGATAGLRQLPGSKANDLLQAVKDLLTESKFKFEPSWVSILDGTEEGAFQWVTINYLLRMLGEGYYGKTVGIVDLGGGSVQMAYAIAEEDAAKAPEPAEGEDAYVKKLKLLGKTYYLYVHSYLHYGLLAARAEVLKLVKSGEDCPCINSGFNDEYTYGSNKYRAVAPASGADYDKCMDLVVEALDVNHACTHLKCTFKGIWNGGGGHGQKKLFVASFFFDRALEAGIIDDPTLTKIVLKPSDFEKAARSVCASSVDEIETKYPDVSKDNRGYVCLDLAYQYALLVKGFGIDPDQEITLIKKLEYKGREVEAAWPLGSAIEVVS